MDKAAHAKIIDQIRKLQALAQSSNVNEAAAAASIARKLIEKHRIEQAELVQAQEEDDDEGIDEDPVMSGAVPDSWWGFTLAGIVAKSHGLVATITEERVVVDGKAKKVHKLWFWGSKADREIVKAFFVTVFGRLRQLLREEMGEKLRSPSWQQDWGMGAAAAVEKALKGAKKEARKEAAQTCSALAIANADLASREIVAEVNRSTERGSTYQVKSERVFEAGYKKGRKAL